MSTQEKMQNSKFHKLFLDELKDIYWAEKALVKALPKMAEASTSQQLKDCFTAHLEETEGHVARLEKVFELLNHKAETQKCEAMSGLIEEAKEIMSNTESDTMVRDAALIIAGQKVEHYEIATYGSLCALAQEMGHQDADTLLHQTLEEEKAADQKLNELALSSVNEDAASE
ncbi:MAG TPA: ferritin-like domain-containing protein [Edaphocola sp.]|nr:ferritin-like domain-containing protein [Edaphocola sp.]